MNNYEPFHNSYTRIKYNEYKSDKLTTYSEVQAEQERALDEGIDEIVMINFVRQSNGGYEGRKQNYFHKNGRWKQEIN